VSSFVMRLSPVHWKAGRHQRPRNLFLLIYLGIRKLQRFIVLRRPPLSKIFRLR